MLPGGVAGPQMELGMTAQDLQAIVDEAKDASADAAFAYLTAHGDKADCGGAWVVISGRCGLARLFKSKSFGKKHHSGGWGFPVVPHMRAQSRIIYEKAADAYVAVLKAHGIEAHTYSYAD